MISQVLSEMIRILGHDHAQVDRAMKVYVYCSVIGDLEGLKGDALRALRAAGILHGIALPEGLDKEGKWDGDMQKRYGEPMVRELLHRLGYDRYIERVAFLVGQCNSYFEEMDNNLDLQILIESTFLVDLSEGRCQEPPKDVYNRYFATVTGRKLMQDLFL
ncbi:MAG: hypothetical protein LBU67_00740 [Oscillospiraceae bacterium]|jgi:hypothetical protein|nr:hypothetical protein [Oscillospiraceae bacterium]